MVVTALEQQSPDASHWSTRSMAKATGMSATTVSRIWRAFELKPQLVENFKLSTGPYFMETLRDVVGCTSIPPSGP